MNKIDSHPTTNWPLQLCYIALFLSCPLVAVWSLIIGSGMVVFSTCTGFLLIPIAYKLIFFSGIEVDVDQKRFRIYKRFLHVRMGEWQSLQNFNAVVVRGFSFAVSNQDAGSDDGVYYSGTSSKNKDYQLYFQGKGKPLKVFTTKDYSLVDTIAEALSMELKFDRKNIKH